MNSGVDSRPSVRTMLTIGLPVRPEGGEGDERGEGDEGGAGGDGPPPLERQGLDPLAEAEERAAHVARVLAGFGYRDGAPQAAAADDPSALIRGAITSSGDESVLVVHLVAHGRVAESGERTLHAVGRDGRNLDDPVSSWISLIESHPDKPRPLTLFLLDLCHSGVAAELPWHQYMRTPERRAWVIAASGAQDMAFGYRLSRATATVLDAYRAGRLRTDPSRRWIPLPTVVREISRTVAELNAEEGLHQDIAGSRVPFYETVDHLPFFPNPEYSEGAGALARLGGELAPLVDEALDPLHFMKRGAGAEALDRAPAQGYFRGRSKEAGVLSAWMNGAGPQVAVVTGKPGVGKSALLGVMVCAAHPALREHTRPLWLPLPRRPAANDLLAIVHARRRTLEEIADSLALQLGAREEDRPAGGWDAGELARLAGAHEACPATLVLDALDEADRPSDVIRVLVQPLAQEALRTGNVRLLIGTRPDPPFVPVLELAATQGLLIDLNTTDQDDLRQGLEEYVRDLLASGGPYERRENAAAAAELAAGIAARLAGPSGPPGEPGEPGGDGRPLEWGEFLVAGLYLRHVLTALPVESDPGRARALGLAAPLELTDLLRLDLARPRTRPWMRPVLAALAHAEGLGMPERVLAHAARAFTADPAHERQLGPDDLREALDQARFYLRHDVDVDGTTLYRLFHEGLAEGLRADPYGLETGAEGGAGTGAGTGVETGAEGGA